MRSSIISTWRYLYTFVVVLCFSVLHGMTTVVTTRQHQLQNRPTYKATAIESLSAATTAPFLSGDWDVAKEKLRDANCCVVSINGLETHMRILQEQLAESNDTYSDLDLRVRINIRKSASSAYQDCYQVLQSTKISKSSSPIKSDDTKQEEEGLVVISPEDDKCTKALEELARGVASMVGGDDDSPTTTNDVYMRIVCATNYQARDPPFHTDKAPLRGYVTLRGLGTEYMSKTCTPLEYMTLRTMGYDNDSGKNDDISNSLKSANELEFIVMKGDYYYNNEEVPPSAGISSSLLGKVWQRAYACVHRSPPKRRTQQGGSRRVIISFDIADGDDDREWYQVGQKREWRNGLTQRKSRLVA